MEELPQFYFKTKEEWSDWLALQHDKSPGIWVVFYKKHTKIACVQYNEVLEEALCFGWIDSLLRKLDEDRYIRKFTPRKLNSQWSEVNKQKIVKLMKEGRMTEAGLNKIKSYRESGKIDWKTEVRPVVELNNIPDYILKSFEENPPALQNFLNLSPSHKRNYIGWIVRAKREETKLRRLAEAVELLMKNKKLGMK